jgi:hypothetical protein
VAALLMIAVRRPRRAAQAGRSDPAGHGDTAATRAA